MPSRRVFKDRILREVAARQASGASGSLVTSVSAFPLASSVASTDRFPLVTSAGIGYRATATLIRGYVLGISGGTANITEPLTLGGLLTTVASATGGAGFRLPHGAAPTSPTNGDLWTTTAGLYGRINGATIGPYTANLGDVVGPVSATDNAVALYDSTTGKIIKNSVVTIASGAVNGVTSIAVSGAGSFGQLGVTRTQSGGSGVDLTAASITASNNATNTISSVIGLVAAASHLNSSGTVTEIVGLKASAQKSAGTASETIGISITGASGAVTNYGLRISAISGGTTNYALYTNAGAVRFGDIVAIGGATPSTTTALIAPAGTTGVSSLRIPHGAAPTSPVDGDMWTTTAGLYVRINGSTIGPLS